MCFNSKESLVPKIKNKIRLPLKWFTKTEHSVMITYYYNDRMRFITLDRDDVPRLLKEFGMITRYEGTGKNRKMYGLQSPEKSKRGFTSDWVETQVQCEDVKIYESDAIQFIACIEYEKIEKIMGFIPTTKQAISSL